jgi:hypothetical protein
MSGASVTAMDLLVALSGLFALALLIAWLISPRLRVWIERPKYRFQSNVRSYDQAQTGKSTERIRERPE